MSIKLLPEGVWSRIAAGEVVERPASAVKEMLENSLDAGAKRIRVKLWDGGRVRIVVEDDGCGISFSDLPLALTAHATSKIAGIEDLEAIHTLGYRGEALASLAAVGKVEIRSRERDGGTGGLIRAYEGRIVDHLEMNCTLGTRVQVDELFGNLPARRKFLKSASGELRRVAALLREYAICRPEVAFSLEHDGRTVFSTEGGGNRKLAIEQFWGAEPPISKTEAVSGHLSLECWWQPRPGRNDVISFVNGRIVTDPLIKGAVSAAAREKIGGWVLFLHVEPSLIDVNIHPAKAEIRFRYPGEVFEVIKAASSAMDQGRPSVLPVREDWNFKEEPFSIKRKPLAPKISPLFSSKPSVISSLPLKIGSSGRWNEPVTTESDTEDLPDFITDAADYTADYGDIAFPADPFDGINYLGQLDSGYLVFEEAGGIVIMDPHAAHERVAFERIRNSVHEGMHEQKLLVPLMLPPTLSLEAEENQELLKNLGFTLDNLEGGLCLTSAPWPRGLDVSPEILLRGSLAALREGGDADPSELLWRSWATMACKEAVKLTSSLEPAEAAALWRDLHNCSQPFFCPHGRPTMLELSSVDLEKHFGRE